MNAVIAAEIQRLTPAEKLQLVQDLWDDIAADTPTPQWHADELTRILHEDGGTAIGCTGGKAIERVEGSIK